MTRSDRAGRPVPWSPRPNSDIVNNGATGTARILVVEDQEDVRRMLVTALELEGHIVDDAATAADGLRHLQQTRYNLVLSDYAMPGGTGTWMLHEATRQGLMDGAVALIVTAHPDVRELGNVAVISKPLDLDEFLEQVRRILGSSGVPGSSGLPPASPGDMRPNVRAGRYRAELVLYVSSASPPSIQARRNLERLLERFDTSQIKFSVCDLAQEPLAGEADRVAFTPTLVKRYPEPRMWVLGNLKDPEIVVDLLHACGIEPKE